MSEEEKIRPKIEEVIPLRLNGGIKTNALSFCAYLRANKTSPVWTQPNTWVANYKGKAICWIMLYGQFNISLRLNHMSEYEESIINESFQSVFWDNISYCVHDGINGQPENHCNPNKKCAGGMNITILGKEFYGVCSGSHSLLVKNPDESVIRAIKELLELEKQARDECKLASRL